MTVIPQVLWHALVLWSVSLLVGLVIFAVLAGGAGAVRWAWRCWMATGDAFDFRPPPTIRRGRPW